MRPDLIYRPAVMTLVSCHGRPIDSRIMKIKHTRRSRKANESRIDRLKRPRTEAVSIDTENPCYLARETLYLPSSAELYYSCRGVSLECGLAIRGICLIASSPSSVRISARRSVLVEVSAWSTTSERGCSARGRLHEQCQVPG